MIKKILCLILIVCFCLSLNTLFSIAIAEQPNQFHTDDSSIFNEEDSFAELNYGFYWATEGNKYHKANVGDDKDFYDNKKPTVIFIHGYQMDLGYHKRETLSSYDPSYIDSEGSVALADYWIDQGYNVLVYYWNQLCDEEMPWDAQIKIWSEQGPLGMRWRQNDGSYTDVNDESNPTKSMAELFVEEYQEIFDKHKGEEIRIVGHSLGGMFSIATMGLIYEMYQNKDFDLDLIPVRLSLIDPYLGLGISPDTPVQISWKEDDDDFYNVKNNEINLVCKDYIKKLNEFGVAIDYYYATIVGELGLVDSDNELDFDLSPYVALVDYYSLNHPRSSGSGLNVLSDLLNSGDLHCEVRDYYFYSINFDSPLDSSYPNTNNTAISAATPTSYVYANAGNYYKITNPDNTLSSQDDIYIITSKDAPDTKSTASGKISGFVFEDKNRTGTRNTINGYEDIEIVLYNNQDKFIASTFTSASGYYSFDTPDAGEYYLVFDKKSGSSFSVYEEDEEKVIYDIPSMVDEEGKTELFSVSSNYSNIVINAGIAPSIFSKVIIIVFIVGIIIAGSVIFAIYLRPKKAKINQ